jgi:hypothetical protein
MAVKTGVRRCSPSPTDSARALSLRRDLATAAIKKALELMGMRAETSASPTLVAASTVMRSSINSVPLRGRDALRMV